MLFGGSSGGSYVLITLVRIPPFPIGDVKEEVSPKTTRSLNYDLLIWLNLVL